MDGYGKAILDLDHSIIGDRERDLLPSWLQGLPSVGLSISQDAHRLSSILSISTGLYRRSDDGVGGVRFKRIKSNQLEN